MSPLAGLTRTSSENVPDNLPQEKLQQKIKEIEDNLKKEAEANQEKEEIEEDPWIEFLENKEANLKEIVRYYIDDYLEG